jgi:hypothetical protein
MGVFQQIQDIPDLTLLGKFTESYQSLQTQIGVMLLVPENILT